MKRKVSRTRRIRLSPNEEAMLVKAEHERRRKLRLQQVREQERKIASRVREDVKQSHEQQVQRLTEELYAEWHHAQEEKTRALERVYAANIDAIGEGHRHAKENEPDLAAMASVAAVQQNRALERHRGALREIRVQRERRDDESSRLLRVRREVQEVERDRAAVVAKLPPPEPEPLERIAKKRSTLVKMYDVGCFSQTHYHLLEPCADREIDTEQVNARSAAVEEERRLQALQQQMEREAKEKAEKAQLRGSHALRMVLLTQDRDRLMQELEVKQQGDWRRRRQAVAQLPTGLFDPPHRRMEIRQEQQRDMEEAFEDLYAGGTRMRADPCMRPDPDPLPAPSVCTQDEEAEELETAGHTDGRELPVLETRPESEVAPAEEAEEEPTPGPSAALAQTSEAAGGEVVEGRRRPAQTALSRLLGRINSQRDQWLSRAHSGAAPPVEPPVPSWMETEDESVVAGAASIVRRREQADGRQAPTTQRQQQASLLEEQKRQQLLLLEQLEQQKRELEARLEQERSEMEAPVARAPVQPAARTLPAPTVELAPEPGRLDREARDMEDVLQEEQGGRGATLPHALHPLDTALRGPLEPGLSRPDDHILAVRLHQQWLLQQNRIHQQSVEDARERLKEYQAVLKKRYSAIFSSAPPTAQPVPAQPVAVPSPAVAAAAVSTSLPVGGPPRVAALPAGVARHASPPAPDKTVAAAPLAAEMSPVATFLDRRLTRADAPAVDTSMVPPRPPATHSAQLPSFVPAAFPLGKPRQQSRAPVTSAEPSRPQAQPYARAQIAHGATGLLRRQLESPAAVELTNPEPLGPFEGKHSAVPESTARGTYNFERDPGGAASPIGTQGREVPSWQTSPAGHQASLAELGSPSPARSDRRLPAESASRPWDVREMPAVVTHSWEGESEGQWWTRGSRQDGEWHGGRGAWSSDGGAQQQQQQQRDQAGSAEEFGVGDGERPAAAWQSSELTQRYDLMSLLFRSLEGSDSSEIPERSDRQEPWRIAEEATERGAFHVSSEDEPGPLLSAPAGVPVGLDSISRLGRPVRERPPVARSRLGLLGLIEQHELSAIPEVDTPRSDRQRSALDLAASLLEATAGSDFGGGSCRERLRFSGALGEDEQGEADSYQDGRLEASSRVSAEGRPRSCSPVDSGDSGSGGGGGRSSRRWRDVLLAPPGAQDGSTLLSVLGTDRSLGVPSFFSGSLLSHSEASASHVEWQTPKETRRASVGKHDASPPSAEGESSTPESGSSLPTVSPASGTISSGSLVSLSSGRLSQDTLGENGARGDWARLAATPSGPRDPPAPPGPVPGRGRHGDPDRSLVPLGPPRGAQSEDSSIYKIIAKYTQQIAEASSEPYLAVSHGPPVGRLELTDTWDVSFDVALDRSSRSHVEAGGREFQPLLAGPDYTLDTSSLTGEMGASQSPALSITGSGLSRISGSLYDSSCPSTSPSSALSLASSHPTHRESQIQSSPPGDDDDPSFRALLPEVTLGDRSLLVAQDGDSSGTSRSVSSPAGSAAAKSDTSRPPGDTEESSSGGGGSAATLVSGLARSLSLTTGSLEQSGALESSGETRPSRGDDASGASDATGASERRSDGDAAWPPERARPVTDASPLSEHSLTERRCDATERSETELDRADFQACAALSDYGSSSRSLSSDAGDGGGTAADERMWCELARAREGGAVERWDAASREPGRREESRWMNSSASRSQDPSLLLAFPSALVWDSAQETGILEEPDLTLVTLTDTESSVQHELSLDVTLEGDSQTPAEVDGGMEQTPGSATDSSGQEGPGPSVSLHSTSEVMVSGSGLAPSSLQEAIRRRKQGFIAQSERRVREARSRDEAVPSATAQRARDRRSKERAAGAAPAKPGDVPESTQKCSLKKVGEVKVMTSADRKSVEEEAVKRTARLYERLGEVKNKREAEQRKDTYTRNREKAKEFHQKTLAKLRSKKL